MSRTMLFTAALLLSACGDKETDDSSAGDSGADDSSAAVTSAEIQAIFDVGCAGCHTGGGTSGNLNLDGFYDKTVGVPSTGAPGSNLIEPGDPDNSYLWQKLNGTQDSLGGSGSQMPLSGSLSNDDLIAIESWISNGAPE